MKPNFFFLTHVFASEVWANPPNAVAALEGGAFPLQRTRNLSFSHTFSPKIARSGGYSNGIGPRTGNPGSAPALTGNLGSVPAKMSILLLSWFDWISWFSVFSSVYIYIVWQINAHNIFLNNSNVAGMDACLTNNGGCQQICTSTPMGAMCSCEPGYELEQDRRNCRGIYRCSSSFILSTQGTHNNLLMERQCVALFYSMKQHVFLLFPCNRYCVPCYFIKIYPYMQLHKMVEHSVCGS